MSCILKLCHAFPLAFVDKTSNCHVPFIFLSVLKKAFIYFLQWMKVRIIKLALLLPSFFLYLTKELIPE